MNANDQLRTTPIIVVINYVTSLFNLIKYLNSRDNPVIIYCVNFIIAIIIFYNSFFTRELKTNIMNITNITNIMNITKLTNIMNIKNITNTTNLTNIMNITNITMFIVHALFSIYWYGCRGSQREIRLLSSWKNDRLCKKWGINYIFTGILKYMKSVNCFVFDDTKIKFILIIISHFILKGS